MTRNLAHVARGRYGVYTVEDMKIRGEEEGWCPYYTARTFIDQASIVVLNYQYVLDPKTAGAAGLSSKEVLAAGGVSEVSEPNSVLVFDEAHNIDDICIEALTVKLDRPLLDKAKSNITSLTTQVCFKKMFRGTSGTNTYRSG